MTDVTHKGGCHCGRVSFEVDAPPSISATLLSSDGLLKSYADYTSSAINETIRGYFGRPLYLNGRCVGTLCCYSFVELNLLPEHQRLIESTSELIEAILRGD